MLHDGRVIPVENVRVGDRLMGPDGGPRKVLSLARGRERLYRVVPTKGAPYVVNASHVLSLRRTHVSSAPAYPCQSGGGIVNLSVKDYLAKSPTFKHEYKGWRTGVDFPPRGALGLLEPYFLGVWLGDGTSIRAEVTTGDDVIVEYLAGYAERLGMTHRVDYNSPGSVSVKIQGPSRSGRGGTKLMNLLRGEGLIDNKHIPHRFKTASRSDRLALLAGLIDTDGSYTGKGYDLTLKSERLLDDAIFVARSLGFSAYKRETTKTCTTNGASGRYFRCNISGDIDEVPCKLSRKQAAPRRQKKSVLVTGIRLERLKVGDYFGFEIDGDRLFLLGDFTVTHNTFIFAAKIAAMHGAAACATAHRKELVSQMSLALAREGVRHRIIGSTDLRKQCVAAHMRELGRDYHLANSPIAAAGVDTLLNHDPNDPWLQQVRLWVQDEAHHVLKENKWGQACALFPNAYGLGVTATPVRADGKGLGAHADGMFQAMVVGPTMRELIDAGYLCDYRVYAPPNDLDLAEVTVTASGDYSPEKLKKARRKSRITGNVVDQYLRLAPGKLGVCFDTDIETATETAVAFRAKGVKAEVVSSKTPDALRDMLLRQLRTREIDMLVNVDLFGEGFDLPAIEVVIMARPTQSYSLYAQQFGRALRKMDGKQRAIIIDHVGNVARHGLPDARREWSLDRRERRGRSSATDAIPTTTCTNEGCYAVFERFHRECPFCGHPVPIPVRSGPEFVDGDLVELDPTLLAAMRGEVLRVDRPPVYPPGVPARTVYDNHMARQIEQQALRQRIALWSGWQDRQGRAHSEQFKRFYWSFGTDVASAMALNAADARKLMERIDAELAKNGVVDASAATAAY